MGLISGFFSTVYRASKGAMGGTYGTVGAKFAKGAFDATKVQACPRCFETDLRPSSDGKHQCGSCEWSGTAEQLVDESQKPVNIAPLVYLAAKGGEASPTSSVVWSRIMWVGVLAILLYSVYWIAQGSIGFSAWTALVAVWLAISAIKYAYRAKLILGQTVDKPMVFLLSPTQWFV